MDYCDNSSLERYMPKTNNSNVESVVDLYKIFVPILLTGCLISLILNTVLVAVGTSAQAKRSNNRSRSPILLLSLNLAATDGIASFLMGIGLVVNSFFPVVFGIKIVHECFTLVLEIFRMSSLIASALHLLALALVHYKGIVNPLHYRYVIFCSQHRTRSIYLMSFICWFLPSVVFGSYFGSIPCQGFQTESCQADFILTFRFRVIVVIAFFIPLIIMFYLYIRIFSIIKQHQRQRALNQNQSSGLRKNRNVYRAPSTYVDDADDFDFKKQLTKQQAILEHSLLDDGEQPERTGEEGPNNEQSQIPTLTIESVAASTTKMDYHNDRSIVKGQRDDDEQKHLKSSMMAINNNGNNNNDDVPVSRSLVITTMINTTAGTKSSIHQHTSPTYTTATCRSYLPEALSSKKQHHETETTESQYNKKQQERLTKSSTINNHGSLDQQSNDNLTDEKDKKFTHSQRSTSIDGNYDEKEATISSSPRIPIRSASCRRDFDQKRPKIYQPNQSGQSSKALITTLLILGTYILCWMPAVIFFLLTCVDHCLYPITTIDSRMRTIFSFITNGLVIMKAIIDPFIYTYRMKEMKTALNRCFNFICPFDCVRRFFPITSSTIESSTKFSTATYSQYSIRTEGGRMDKKGGSAKSIDGKKGIFRQDSTTTTSRNVSMRNNNSLHYTTIGNLRKKPTSTNLNINNSPAKTQKRSAIN